MPKQKLYSIQELSEQTKIPASTVRYYRDEYKEYFPSTRPEGARYPVYEKECLEVLGVIREGLQEGLQKHEVIKKLNNKFTPIYDGNSDKAAKEHGGNQQTSNKQLATNESQSPNVMQTLNQMATFNDNQVQLTEHYKKQAEQQRGVIENLEATKEVQLERIEDLERRLKEVTRTTLWDVLKRD